MKKIGYGLFLVGVLIMIFCCVNKCALEKDAKENIEYYINDTSLQKDDIESPVEEKQEPINNNNNIKYTAVIEVPSINLKQGVVDSTKRFYSINYAISVDKKSRYPDQNGNFILYSHSGNSSIAFFDKLIEIKQKDDIYIYYKGVKYHYVVNDIYNIKKSGKASVLSSNSEKYITLITCNQNKKGYQLVVVGSLLEQLDY